MGLTSSSTGTRLLNNEFNVLQENSDYTVTLARKS